MTTTVTARPAGSGDSRQRPTRGSGAQARRRVPWIVAGVLLIAGSALVFATVSVREGGSRQVLAVTRSLPAGHVLAASDLESDRLSDTGSVPTVAAPDAGQMVGRMLAVPVATGALLTTTDLGPPAQLRAGEALVAVALKPGEYPPALAAGAHVMVVDTGSPAAAQPLVAGGSTVSVSAVVMAVDTPAAGSSDASVVVSLQLSASDAPTVARLGAAGQAALIVVPAGS